MSGEAQEREAYESSPIVQTCRMLLGQSFGEIVKISLQDFLDASVRGNGALAAATKQELSARLTALSPQLLQYDGILIAQGKRVGSQRGIYISTSAQKGEKHGQE